jgi:hypothetical protein
VIEVCSFEGTQQCRCIPPLPEDGNRSSFRNVIFSSYLEFRTMDRGSEVHRGLSKPLEASAGILPKS